MKKFFVFLGINIVLCQACSVYTTVNHKKFSLLHAGSPSTNLPKDGYYYSIYDSVKYYEGDSYKKAVYSFFLYNDGFFAQTITRPRDLDSLENYLRNITPEDKRNLDGAFSWGKYIVNNDSIYIEYFSHRESNYVDVKKAYGIIEKDSEIIITGKTNFRTDGIPDDIQEKFPARYRFKKFSAKPDSINWIMKRKW